MNDHMLQALTRRLIELRGEAAASQFGPDCLRDYYEGQARAYEQALYALYAFSAGRYGVDYADAPAPVGRALLRTKQGAS